MIDIVTVSQMRCAGEIMNLQTLEANGKKESARRTSLQPGKGSLNSFLGDPGYFAIVIVHRKSCN